MDDRIETNFLSADQLTTPAHDPDPNPDQSSGENAPPKDHEQDQDQEQEAKVTLGFAESGRRR